MSYTETFNAIPSGLIQSGTASVSVNTDTGALSYLASVKYGLGFLSKTQSFNGEYSVDPSMLLSSFLNAVGKSITFQTVTLTVAALGPGYAALSIAVAGQNISGTAQVDTTGQYIQVNSAQVTAKVYGLNLNILLQKVS